MGTLGDPETQRKRAFASAVRSLTRRPRTRVEIEDFLEKREYSREVIAQTIERLLELNYLDEAAVADVVVRDVAPPVARARHARPHADEIPRRDGRAGRRGTAAGGTVWGKGTLEDVVQDALHTV